MIKRNTETHEPQQEQKGIRLVKKQVNVDVLLTIAETLSRLDTDHLPSNDDNPEKSKLIEAIFLSRMELGGRAPRPLHALPETFAKNDMTAGVKSWISRFAEQTGTNLFERGPVDMLFELGNVPAGHVIVGLDKNVSDIVELNKKAGELVRGVVQSDMSVEWELTIDINRSRFMEKLFDEIDIKEVLCNHMPDKKAHIASANMSFMYKKANNNDEWKSQVNLYEYSDPFPTNMQMILRFKPDDITIIAAELDGKDILPLLVPANNADASRDVIEEPAP